MKSSDLSNRNQRNHRRGLTLIELLLVLVILIAIAGVLVPIFSNTIGMAHASSSSSNIESTSRALETHKAMFGGYPSQQDLLLTDNTDNTTLAPFGGTIAATELTTVAVSARIGDALEEAGITQVVENPVDDGTLGDEEDMTIFGLADNTSATRVVAVSATAPANLVTLGTDAIARLGLDPTASYVVLGVGNNNDGIGKIMVDAPVHFLPDGGSNEDIYSRFLAVYRIPGEEGGAVLATVCTVDVHDGAGEVIGLNGHIREFNHSRE